MDLKINKHFTVVFDLDDTLYNELDYLKSAYTEIAKKIDPQEWKLLFVKMFSLYRDKRDVFKYLSEKYTVSLESLLDQYRTHKPKIVLFDGVNELVAKIIAKQAKIAILTDGRSITQKNKIKALGLENTIDLAIISEEIGSEKPSLKNFKKVEEELPNSNFIYIGDNIKKDFITPNELGWQTIGLIDKGLNIHYLSHSYMDKKHLPRHWVFNLNEISII